MLNFSWRLRATRQLACAALLAVVTGAWTGASPAMAATLEGQTFDETTVLSERTLRLNGLGLRGVAWIKAFVAGLYLPAPTKDSAQVLSMPGPKRLRLKIMLEAPSHELTKSLTSRIARHEPEAVKSQIDTRLQTLAALIDGLGDLKVGDTIDLDFQPDRGTVLRFNEKLVGQPVAGDDLYRAVLKIFVGEHPADKRMKEGLLRGGV
jgi:Chalcone isomerase-like